MVLAGKAKAVYTFGMYQWGMPVEKAKVFWSGRSQAVRLPKGYRFQAEEVRIRRHGISVVLEPIAQDWVWLDELCGKLDPEIESFVNERPEEQERPGLDKLFE
jgi:antitoxin VapB